MKVQPETQQLLDIAAAYRKEHSHIPKQAMWLLVETALQVGLKI